MLRRARPRPEQGAQASASACTPPTRRQSPLALLLCALDVAHADSEFQEFGTKYAAAAHLRAQNGVSAQ
jgi:hypothetical protein